MDDKKDIVGKIEFGKNGIDWTLNFDEFIRGLSERKEKELKYIMERSDGTFDAASDFNGASIWQLYSTIDVYRNALRYAVKYVDFNDKIDCFSYFVNKNRRGR